MLLAIVAFFVMGVSRRDGNWVIGWVQIILRFIRDIMTSEDRVVFERSIEEIPRTFDSVLSQFKLDGQLEVRIVCPECHANYVCPDERHHYPSTCTNSPDLGSVCGAALLDHRGDPLKPCTFHAFGDYLGALLSRPDIEEAIEGSQGGIDSAFPLSGEFLRDFHGLDKTELFLCGGELNETRLVFSLCVDFFAAEGMRIRGPTNSLGIIALVCLNLPIEIRYKPENMYLYAIIPGPKEPSLAELNHYMDPLIDNMLVAWECGHQLSRTALHPQGRLVRSAIALVVCDLPASRKTAALASSLAKIFCHVCNCWDCRDHDGQIVSWWRELRGRTDCHEWRRRDVATMRAAAERWRDAETVAERNRIFEMHGVRWSPLWRLPYWDPTRQLVVDSMHCLLEGLVKFHFLSTLGLSESTTVINSRIPPAFSWSFSQPDDVEINESAMDVEADNDNVDEAEGDAQPPRQHIAPDDTLPWTSKELQALRGIQRNLTAALRKDDDQDAEVDSLKTVEQLRNYLAGRSIRALRYVVHDLSLSVQVLTRRKKATRREYAEALIQWVSCLLFLNYTR